jgi:hypothetical protein
MPFPLISRNHSPVLGLNKPILLIPLASQSPATGRSPSCPKEPTQRSILQPSNFPPPSRSRNHSPVLGRNTPILLLPVPFQSPAIGRSPLCPNDRMHLSLSQPFHFSLPLRSKYHRFPVCDWQQKANKYRDHPYPMHSSFLQSESIASRALKSFSSAMGWYKGLCYNYYLRWQYCSLSATRELWY